MGAISKMLLCALPRFFRRHSTADVLFRPQIDVKLPFFRDLAMHFVAMSQRSQTHAEFRYPAHGSLPSGRPQHLGLVNETRHAFASAETWRRSASRDRGRMAVSHRFADGREHPPWNDAGRSAARHRAAFWK